MVVKWKVFSQCPYECYDLMIGTSDKRTSVDDFECPQYKHLLIMFGGLQGLEMGIENDPILQIDDPKLLCDHYLNTLPNQGSKTIRTEEAILVRLAVLKPKLNSEEKCVESQGFESESILVDSRIVRVKIVTKLMTQAGSTKLIGRMM